MINTCVGMTGAPFYTLLLHLFYSYIMFVMLTEWTERRIWMFYQNMDTKGLLRSILFVFVIYLYL